MIEPAGLHLRFRDDAATSGSSEPPDVAAFVRAPSTRAPREEFAVLPGSRAVDAGEPIVVFLQQAEFGIPAPGYDASLPDLESWSVQATKFGWIATVAPPARGPGPWRAARAMERAVAGARAPFDLTTGPLLRVELLEEAAQIAKDFANHSRRIIVDARPAP